VIETPAAAATCLIVTLPCAIALPNRFAALSMCTSTLVRQASEEGDPDRYDAVICSLLDL
jgi:hypothetical protein